MTAIVMRAQTDDDFLAAIDRHVNALNLSVEAVRQDWQEALRRWSAKTGSERKDWEAEVGKRFGRVKLGQEERLQLAWPDGMAQQSRARMLGTSQRQAGYDREAISNLANQDDLSVPAPASNAGRKRKAEPEPDLITLPNVGTVAACKPTTRDDQLEILALTMEQLDTLASAVEHAYDIKLKSLRQELKRAIKTVKGAACESEIPPELNRYVVDTRSCLSTIIIIKWPKALGLKLAGLLREAADELERKANRTAVRTGVTSQ